MSTHAVPRLCRDAACTHGDADKLAQEAMAFESKIHRTVVRLVLMSVQKRGPSRDMRQALRSAQGGFARYPASVDEASGRLPLLVHNHHYNNVVQRNVLRLSLQRVVQEIEAQNVCKQEVVLLIRA